MITLLIAGLVLGFLLVAGISNVSPGPLSAIHAAQPELQGRKSCVQCHGSGQTTLAKACTNCHPQITEQVERGTGFHGTNAVAKLPNCGQCHFEHLGSDSPLIGDRAFIRAGFAGARAFRHEQLGFELVGKHVSSKCDACHKHAFKPQIANGEHRFTASSQKCTACHKDPHEGKLADCNGCHGQEKPFTAVTEDFVHDSRVALVGGHASARCDQCHPADEVIRAFQGRTGRGNRPVRSCDKCHERPHTGGFLQGIDSRGASCSDCHLPEHVQFTASDWARSRALHEASGFELAPNHEQVACGSCHLGLGTKGAGVDIGARFKARFPGNRLRNDCASCHDDPHDRQFVNADKSPRTCSDCHEGHFVPPKFDRARHEETAFPLRGSHREVACDRCHVLEPGKLDPKRFPSVRRFVGTKSDCSSCHENPHPGDQFSERLAAKGDCKGCHEDIHFRPALLTVAEHEKTRFPLRDSHKAVACNRCHTPRNGRLRQISDVVFHGTSRECKDCHVDVHDRHFDRPGLPRLIGGKAGCDRCHTPGKFELNEPAKFRHGFWTGFELEGEHAKASCDSCHPKAAPTHGGTRFMARAQNKCSACHEDTHRGQLEVKGTTDCRRCHDAQPGWNPKHFDHNRDSRFKLDGNHDGLECSKCHEPFRAKDGGKIVRYKPLGVTCSSCHRWREGGR